MTRSFHQMVTIGQWEAYRSNHPHYPKYLSQKKARKALSKLLLIALFPAEINPWKLHSSFENCFWQEQYPRSLLEEQLLLAWYWEPLLKTLQEPSSLGTAQRNEQFLVQTFLAHFAFPCVAFRERGVSSLSKKRLNITATTFFFKTQQEYVLVSKSVPIMT